MISYIFTIKIADSLIYINNNRKQLLVFEKNGKFKYQIGSQGEGPGEYLEINDYIINKDNIELLDFKKILTYSLTGEYLETKNFDLLNDTVYCNAEDFCHSPLGGYYFWGGTSGKFGVPMPPGVNNSSCLSKLVGYKSNSPESLLNT